MFQFKFKKMIIKNNPQNWKKTTYKFKSCRGTKDYLTLEKTEYVNKKWYKHSFYGPAHVELVYRSNNVTKAWFLLGKEFHDFEWETAREAIVGFKAATDRKINGKKSK